MAVRLGDFVILFGGYDNVFRKALSCCVIWMYNLYTERWTNYAIRDNEGAPGPYRSASAVAIDGDIYMFGGVLDASPDNCLWKLTTTALGCFEWSKIETYGSKKPSPRSGHSAWAYDRKLWILGGCGTFEQGAHFDEYGDFEEADMRYNSDLPDGTGILFNNQLLFFDIFSNEWTNARCFGEVPSPCSDHASTIFGDKVWLFGGRSVGQLCELDLHSLTWTHVRTNRVHTRFHSCTLTAVTENKLVLHGGTAYFGSAVGYRSLKDTYILDLPSKSWSSSMRCANSQRNYSRQRHKACVGINTEVIITGGDYYVKGNKYVISLCDMTSSVMAEPKSLQQIAMKIVDKHRNALPWQQCLPRKLERLFY